MNQTYPGSEIVEEWLSGLARSQSPRALRVGNNIVSLPVRHFVSSIALTHVRAGYWGLCVHLVPLFGNAMSLSDDPWDVHWNGQPATVAAAGTGATMEVQRAFENALVEMFEAVPDTPSYLIRTSAFLTGGPMARRDAAALFASDGRLDDAVDVARVDLGAYRREVADVGQYPERDEWPLTRLARRSVEVIEGLLEAIPRGPAAVEERLLMNERESARRLGIEHIYEPTPFPKLRGG
jgi:hypothetical protein